MKTFAIVCAAGSGRRFGGTTPKQFLFLKDKMIVEYSLSVFEKSPFIDGIVILIPEGYKEIGEMLKEKYKKILFWDYGENERANTVRKGLELIKDMCDFVAIHDAARPFINLDLIEKLILEVKNNFAVAPAVLARDTVKYVVDGYVQNTISRENVWLVQTPQVFKFELIYKAYKRFKDSCFTDDLQYVEKLGIKPKIVENTSLNFKITTQEDMIFAQAVVEKFLK